MKRCCCAPSTPKVGDPLWSWDVSASASHMPYNSPSKAGQVASVGETAVSRPRSVAGPSPATVAAPG